MENDIYVLDCETYPNYFLLAMKNLETLEVSKFELRGEDSVFTREQSREIKSTLIVNKSFGFNSNNFDMPVIMYACNSHSAKEVFDLANKIITDKETKIWDIKRAFGVDTPVNMDHFDIKDPTPGMVGLKLYGTRINSKHLQELPIAPGTTLTEEQMDDISKYCENDLNVTIDLYRNVKDRFDLRFEMSKKYGWQVMSAGDAKLAEIVIKSEVQKVNPSNSCKRLDVEVSSFKYDIPNRIEFKTENLQHILSTIRDHNFIVDKATGKVILPDFLETHIEEEGLLETKKSSSKKPVTSIQIGDIAYTLGIGGLHSTEKNMVVVPKYDELLINKDVASYYPNIIINQELSPESVGKDFIPAYKEIVKKRLAAKKSGDKVTDKVLKIVINGSFGKFGSKYSYLYSPKLLIQTTLTGQLALLMLIESLELAGCRVVSANTDGFVTVVPCKLKDLYEDICLDWELKMNLDLEAEELKCLVSRDVNNYIAVKGGKVTRKGKFSISDVGKNIDGEIISDAMCAYIKDGIPVADTINSCKNISKFMIGRTAKRGATWKGEYLGKVVRWYYGFNGQPIYTIPEEGKKPAKVASSDGAIPVMDLPDVLPEDIDLDKYIQIAEKFLTELTFNL